MLSSKTSSLHVRLLQQSNPKKRHQLLTLTPADVFKDIAVGIEDEEPGGEILENCMKKNFHVPNMRAAI